MKTIFEKRFEINLKKYMDKSKEELKKYEDNMYENVYKDFSLDEVLAAEFEIIEEDLKNEMINKSLNKEYLEEYNNYLEIIRNIKNKCEIINYNDENIKRILTIIQLSLNIKPSFITTVDYVNLYDTLNSFNNKVKIKSIKE